MVRTEKPHHHYHHHHLQDQEDDDDPHAFAFPSAAAASGNDGSSQRDDGRSSEQRASNSRSKHSETEQRRRCKINERFQILKDLIPPNDQKRDKASLLLEVIEYIQFLQEKLHVYEASYPGWSQEPAKLTPWRSSAPVECFVDHLDIMKSPGHDNNVVQPTRNEQWSEKSNFGGVAAYIGKDHLAHTDASAVPLVLPFHPSIYPSGTSFLPSETHSSQPLMQTTMGRPSTIECPITGTSSSETQPSDISSVYSQGIMKNLTQAFRSSGVDLSQTSILVQLDIGKRANTSAAATKSAAEVQVVQKVPQSNRSMSHCETGSENYDSIQAAKRSRIGET